jgi:hypothetical protein
LFVPEGWRGQRLAVRFEMVEALVPQCLQVVIEVLDGELEV